MSIQNQNNQNVVEGTFQQQSQQAPIPPPLVRPGFEEACKSAFEGKSTFPTPNSLDEMQIRAKYVEAKMFAEAGDHKNAAASLGQPTPTGAVAFIKSTLAQKPSVGFLFGTGLVLAGGVYINNRWGWGKKGSKQLPAQPQPEIPAAIPVMKY